jgi:hypothetical protein
LVDDRLDWLRASCFQRSKPRQACHSKSSHCAEFRALFPARTTQQPKIEVGVFRMMLGKKHAVDVNRWSFYMASMYKVTKMGPGKRFSQ